MPDKITTERTIEHFVKDDFATHPSWAFDPASDGKIIKHCKELDAAGFVVTRIYRKGKVQVRYPSVEVGDMSLRYYCMVSIGIALEDNVKEVTFNKNYIFIHFEMGHRIKRGY